MLVALAIAAAARRGTASPPCLLPPVAAPIVDPFREPLCQWCPGNRGLTYQVRAGTTVRAAAAGTVTFSGVVAGTRYVVVAHADGLRATYGGLSSSALGAGDAVAAGGVVGTSGDELHFGLRDGERYLDPEPLLGRGRPPGPAGPDGRHPTAPGAAAPAAVPGTDGRERDRGPVHCSIGSPTGGPSDPTQPAAMCGRSGAGGGPVNRQGVPRWLSSRCGRCSRPVSTSDTRPGAGTRR